MDDNTDPCPTLCPLNKVPSFKICGTTEKCLQTKPARHLSLVQKLLVCFYNPVLHVRLCLGCVEKKYCVLLREVLQLFVSWLWLHLRSRHGFHRRTGRKDRSEIITAFAFSFFFFSSFVCCCLLCFSKYLLNSRHYALLCSFFASADVLCCVASRATNWTRLYFKLEHFFFFFLENGVPSIHLLHPFSPGLTTVAGVEWSFR